MICSSTTYGSGYLGLTRLSSERYGEHCKTLSDLRRDSFAFLFIAYLMKHTDPYTWEEPANKGVLLSPSMDMRSVRLRLLIYKKFTKFYLLHFQPITRA